MDRNRWRSVLLTYAKYKKTALYLLQATQLRVVVLWRCYIKFIQTQEEHGVLRTNIMKYRL